jgi:hypothetical protein
MSKFRSLLAAVSILLCAATLPVNGGLPKRHPAIAGYFLFQQDIPAKTVVLKGQGATPANPSAGWYKLFVDNAGALKLLDSAGSVTTFGAGGGGFELQTETSFTNNGNPALYLAGPVGSVTPFALFVNSNLDSMFSVSETGRMSSVDVEAANGTFIAGNNNNLTFSMDTGGTTLRFYKYGAFEVVSASTLSSGLPKSFLSWTDANDHSGITASTEYKAFWSNAAPTYTWATGALTNNRFFHLTAPTVAFEGASTLTNAATFAISGAPAAGTNATITNPYALWVESGLSRFDGRVNAVNSDASNPAIQSQNDTGTALRGISLSSYGAYLTSRSSIGANIAQTGTLSGNTTAATALIKREHVLSGFTSTGPVLQVEQATGTGNLLSLVNSGGTQAAFDQNGVLLIGSASSPGTATKLQLGTPSTANNNVNLYLEPTATTITPLAIQGNPSQTADLFQVFKSDGTKLFFVNSKGVATGSPSGIGINATAFGYLALDTGGGVNATVFGNSAGYNLNSSGTDDTLIGSNAGYGLTTGAHNVVVGSTALQNDQTISSSVIIGSGALNQSNGGYTGTGPVLAIGRSAGSDLTNQNNIAVFGSATSPLNDWYFGESYSTASPSDITFQPSVASGTNIAGSSFYLKGGAGTGNATPGKLYLQYASAGSSGATVQSYTTAVTIDSAATDVAGLLQVDRIAGTTSAPSISAGAAAGTSPTVSVTGTDLGGEIVVTTGTGSVGSGTLATITLNVAFANDCYPVLQAADADSRGLAVSITHSSTGFTIVAGAAGWSTSTEYRWTYIVAGR